MCQERECTFLELLNRKKYDIISYPIFALKKQKKSSKLQDFSPDMH